ncbi:MAG: tetratricopeptide repeat protein, partial [Candidatus Marinimicrobia bacterium]|nr:tetratricopeptide repeat protein [Candidatus Neomarinimicrobiota bacterium]
MSYWVLGGGIARAQETPDEVRVAAHRALQEGAFEEAAGLLARLVDWYADSKQQVIVGMMGDVYFNLGLCHFFLAAFSEAESVFDTYLERYRNGAHAEQVSLLRADALRFQSNFKAAATGYVQALQRFPLSTDLRADAYAGLARCALGEQNWAEALPHLLQVYRIAPDFSRRNWAATLLAIAFLQERRLDDLYSMTPMLLRPHSFASRSVAYNLTALQVGDELFADEQYRDALWIFRLVYPHDLLALNASLELEFLQGRLERVKKNPRNPRPLIRTQEAIAEVEAEIEALGQIENYDPELFYRIARAYNEFQRYREARDLFYQIYEDQTPNQAEEALYLAFVCGTRVTPLDSAFTMGAEYMEAYAAGEFYDEVSLTLGQLHARASDWPAVIAVLTQALEVQPAHTEIVECLFLLGYAGFMDEQFARSVEWLTRLNTDFPGNEREFDAVYWTGMSLLFDKQYEAAIPFFTRLMDDDPEGLYTEDASFRRATCFYALSRLDDAEEALQAFVARYPESRLMAEAFVLLGDTAGAHGDLPQAGARYRRALQLEEQLHIELYNHAAFRAGEMLNDLKAYDLLVSHFRAYIERNREESNLPLAIYWVGNAYWQMGDTERALSFYRDAIARYGPERLALGIDLILEEWVGKAKALPLDQQKDVWRGMSQLHDQAGRDRQVTLVLRLKRIL